MSRSDNLYELPEGLPVPVDDGAADHLAGMEVPPISLPSTAGRAVSLAGIAAGRVVLYCYPRTGRPDLPRTKGWDQIPGARGCTPQSCAFRDHYREIKALGAEVFGLSAQTTEEQKEFSQRAHIPFELLSDAAHVFAKALRLPTFQVESMTLLKRLTLILSRGRVEKVFYPVFPPEKNADEVIAWLAANPR